MFSERTAWPRDANPLARAIEEAKARAGVELVDLTVSNPTTVGLEYESRRILDALAADDSLTYRPAPFGLPEARRAVAEYYARRGIAIAEDDVILCATTSEAYAFLFHLLANAGESIAIPRPSYPLFSYLADLSDLMLSPYHLRYGPKEGWRLDTSSLTEAIDPTTRAIVTVTPNNPTGSHANEEEKRWLVSTAARGELAIISDEVFLDFVTDRAAMKDATFAKTEGALAFTLSGVSKVAGLPQMKLSWIVLSGPQGLVSEARARLEIVSDTFLSLATPIQRALPEVLAAADAWQERLRARIAQNRRALDLACAGSPVIPRASAGGWYAMVDLPLVADDEAWALKLVEEHAVLAHPGYLFDVEEPSALVLSTIVPPDEFARGVERIVACASENGPPKVGSR